MAVDLRPSAPVDLQPSGSVLLVPADRNYVHTQIAASAEWRVTHNLGKKVAVTVVDSAGTVVIGEVCYEDLNTVVLTFSAPFSGQAFFN